MFDVKEVLERWKISLCPSVSLGGQFARNPTAHKWKAMYRSLVLREAVFWRTHDLLTQADVLYEAKHILGSRILIRGALETIATLIHLNQLTARVLSGQLAFSSFDEKTLKLMLGSRNDSTRHKSINIVTVLEQCEKKYTGISTIYATLSECAHPNYEGVCVGYSDVNHALHETHFSNKWSDMWADRNNALMEIICRMFEEEYNNVWPSQLEKLEIWLTDHDVELEAARQKQKRDT